jgi:hypothetical protein
MKILKVKKKKISIVFLVCIWFANPVSAQSNDFSKYPVKLSDIQAKIPKIQEYEVTSKRNILNPIDGSKIYGDAVRATYFTFDNDSVKWKNVKWGEIADLRQEQFDETDMAGINDFTYKSKTADFLKGDFYNNIPPPQKEWAMWLVSDAVAMQEFVWYIVDSLEYKKEFTPKLMENYEIKADSSYTFSSKYLKYIWTGITEHNNELCAIVKFESLFNLLSDVGGKEGRSMYYGEWWISLEDKQIEYSTMVEDVISQDQSSKQLLDMQRIIVFNKVR